MNLEFLAKDAESGKTGCPSVYAAEDGSLVVQGRAIDQATHANMLNVADGEAGVHIDADTVIRALKAKGLL